jgi:hypothetical protein
VNWTVDNGASEVRRILRASPLRISCGELRRLAENKSFAAQYLRANSGISLDELTEKVWDSGLTFERPTINEVLDFLEVLATGIDGRRGKRSENLEAFDATLASVFESKLRRHKFACAHCKASVEHTGFTPKALCFTCFELDGVARPMELVARDSRPKPRKIKRESAA